MKLDRDGIIEDYVNKSVEDMDINCMENLLKELIAENMDEKTDQELVDFIQEGVYPEVLEGYDIQLDKQE